MPKFLSDKQDFEITDAMEQKMQARLDAIPDPDDADFEDIPEVKSKKKEVAEETDEEIVEEVDEEVIEEKDEDVDKDVDKDEDEIPALPENLYRAAIHSDWTPEEIQEFYQANPEKALKTFKKIYTSTNDVSRTYAELGKVQMKQTQDALTTEQEKANAEKNEYKGVDIAALEKQFGESDPAVLAILKAQDERSRLLHDEIVELKKAGASQSRETGLSNDQRQIVRDVNAFFGDKDFLEAYGDFYGKVESGQNWGEVLTGEQHERRRKVCVEADQIKAGAALRDIDMDRSEALRRAHAYVSDEVKEQAIRNGLRKKTVKRNKGITVKSTGRKPVETGETSEKKSEKKLEGKVKGYLKKAFGGNVE